MNESRIVPQRVSPAASIPALPALHERTALLKDLSALKDTLDLVVLRLADFTDEPRYDAMVPLL
jgi:hypothetical protein